MLDDNDPSNDTRGLHALAVTLLQAGDRTNAGAILAILFKPLEDLPMQEAVEDDNIDQQDGGTDDAEEQYRSENQPDPLTSSVGEDGEADILPGEKVLKSEAPTLEGGVSAAVHQVPQVTDTTTIVGPTNIADTAVPVPSVPATEPTASQLKLQLGNSWMYTCDGCSRDAQDAGEMYFCEVCLDKNYCGDCLPKVKTASLWSRQCNHNHTHYQAWPIPSEARDLAVEWVEGEAALRSEWLEKLRKEWIM